MSTIEAFQNLPSAAKLVLLGSVAFLLYTTVSILSLSSRRRSIQQAKGTSPPPRLPQWDRVFGLDVFQTNIKAFKEHRLLNLAYERFESMGVNTFSIVMLDTRLIVTREPENLKAIQATDHKIWSLGSRRITAFTPLLGAGIFTTDGAEWAHSREMIRPNFVRSQVADLTMFETHIQDLITHIPKDGSTVDLSELFFLLTMDSATDFLFGHSTGALKSGNVDGFADAFNRSQVVVANRARWGIFATPFRWVFHRPHFEKDRKFIHEFVDSFVQQGMTKRDQLIAEKKSGENSSGRYVFIDELIRQTNDRVRVRSELLNVLLAGRDTTASLLSNAWFYLGKRPDIWQKLQEEIAFLGGDAPTFEQIKDMKYVKALLNESLRLHPVVPFNTREALEDTTIPVGGGPDGKSPIFIKKGQIVGWSVYALHRRKDFYGEDAEEFRPERWLDDASGKKGLRPGWEYLPFNGGARICLGQQFALTEASYTTVRLLQAFSKIESRDPEPWRESLSLTCTSLGGAKVSLTPR